MSGPIKPEDIPNGLMAEFGHIYGPDLVAFLNAAVEAGVVSPPVWNVVNLASSQIVATFESRSEAESEAARQALLRRNCAVEHWKGQAE